MKFRLMNSREREIWRRAKIAGYYAKKSRDKRQTKAQDKPRYGSFDVNDAFQKALRRSYGDKFKD